MSRALLTTEVGGRAVFLHSRAGRAPRKAPQLAFSGGADAVLLAVPSAALGLVAGKRFPSTRAPPGLALSSKARPRGRCGFLLFPHRPYQSNRRQGSQNREGLRWFFQLNNIAHRAHSQTTFFGIGPLVWTALKLLMFYAARNRWFTIFWRGFAMPTGLVCSDDQFRIGLRRPVAACP